MKDEGHASLEPKQQVNMQGTQRWEGRQEVAGLRGWHVLIQVKPGTRFTKDSSREIIIYPKITAIFFHVSSFLSECSIPMKSVFLHGVR
jgi:hypothetical protein